MKKDDLSLAGLYAGQIPVITPRCFFCGKTSVTYEVVWQSGFGFYRCERKSCIEKLTKIKNEKD